MSMEIVMAERFLVKNLLVSVAGQSPYQALFGRVPPILAEFEPMSECQLDDGSAGIAGVSRHHHRLREMAVQSMVESTAQQRMARALHSKTRVTHESLNLQPGDQVDFYRSPATKDESGWRGPATVIRTGPAVIQWQDKYLQVSTQDLRRSLSYLALLVQQLTGESFEHYNFRTDESYILDTEDPTAMLVTYADGMTAFVVIRKELAHFSK